MPVRRLRHEILFSFKVDQLDNAVETFYRRLMSVVDDFGRFDAHPVILRAACYPLRVEKIRLADIPRWLATCEKAGLIVLYEIDGKPYLVLLNVEKPRAEHSKYPDPPNHPALSCARMRADGPYSYSSAHSSSSSSTAAGAAGKDMKAGGGRNGLAGGSTVSELLEKRNGRPKSQ